MLEARIKKALNELNKVTYKIKKAKKEYVSRKSDLKFARANT